MRSVVRIKFGSHLYGTNTPQSDLDYKSVHVPDGRDILLQRVKKSINSGPRKAKEGEKNTPDAVDEGSYSLQRYLQLLVGGQTVAIDMLFAPNPIETSPLWKHIHDNRHRLLTKKSAAFVGYCRTQANKYGIKGNRVAAAKVAMEGFAEAQAAYGSTAKVGDMMSDRPRVINEHTRVIEKETTPGRFETYFECCNRMVGFKNTLKEAEHIFTRIYEEYGKRARLAETTRESTGRRCLTLFGLAKRLLNFCAQVKSPSHSRTRRISWRSNSEPSPTTKWRPRLKGCLEQSN